MKFAVLSDIHYISRRMMPGVNDRRLQILPAVSETALRMASELEDIDTILITGDLADSGDLYSHEDLIAILHSLQEKGKKVYVTTATHDFHHHKAWVQKYGSRIGYNRWPWSEPFFDPNKQVYKNIVRDEYKHLPEEQLKPDLIPACTPAELWDLYADFGRNQAVSVCDEGMSYCVELDEKTWCLMLNDNFRNEENFHNVSVTYSPACLRWIDGIVKQAKEKGVFVFACTHHPLVPPVPAYKIGAGYRDMRSPEAGHRLADLGISLVFSGHSHFSDISFMESDNGNLLCDITTPSVRHYPPQFRVADLDGENGRINVRSIDIAQADGFTIEEENLRVYFRKEFIDEYADKVARMKAPLNTIVSSACIKHLYPLCKNTSKLTKEEYESIKNTRIFDLVMNLVMHMMGGDGIYTPDTPEYKFMMGLSATLDSLLEAQPFYDIRKKVLKGYTISEIIEPMLFNNYIPDTGADFDFTKKPEKRFDTPAYKNYAGDIVMLLLTVLAIPLCKAVSPLAGIGVAVGTVLHHNNRKKHPIHPERY